MLVFPADLLYIIIRSAVCSEREEGRAPARFMANTKNDIDYSKRIITIPNILSMVRIILIPLFVYLYLNGLIWQSAVVLVISGLTDTVDGFVARRFHMISDFGKALDPVADKLTQAAMLVCLGLKFPLMWIPFGLMVIKENAGGILGLVTLKKTGNVYGALWYGKVTTVLLYVTMGLHVVWPGMPSWLSAGLILLCTAFLVYSMVMYGIRYHNLLKNGVESGPADPSEKQE